LNLQEAVCLVRQLPVFTSGWYVKAYSFASRNLIRAIWGYKKDNTVFGYVLYAQGKN